MHSMLCFLVLSSWRWFSFPSRFFPNVAWPPFSPQFSIASILSWCLKRRITSSSFSGPSRRSSWHCSSALSQVHRAGCEWRFLASRLPQRDSYSITQHSFCYAQPSACSSALVLYGYTVGGKQDFGVASLCALHL